MPHFQSEEIEIHVKDYKLGALLSLPDDPIGLVIFAHGSGSSRHSQRNQFVARSLNRRKIATLLADLLTEAEASDRTNVFDLDLLAERVSEITVWASRQESLNQLGVGYFGASTGGGAAIQAAARNRDIVKAVVSRGGRPDLAAKYLPMVTAPTLLIVGGNDEPVTGLNRWSYERLGCVKRFEVIEGATHLFEEAGALEKVAWYAGEWFEHFLKPATQRKRFSQESTRGLPT